MPYKESEDLPECLADNYICLDEEIREKYIDRYVDRTLPEPQQEEFEDHLALCFKCREDVAYLRRVRQAVRDHGSRQQESGSPLHALYDYQRTDLMPYYEERPLSDQMAAASVRVGRLVFPVTVEYLGGQVIGQFWKRVGYLFFRLTQSSVGEKKAACILIYSPGAESEEFQQFDVQEGQEIRLGPFYEFADSDSVQDVVRAIKRFQLIVK